MSEVVREQKCCYLSALTQHGLCSGLPPGFCRMILVAWRES